MDNDRKDGEGQISAGKTSGVEGVASDRAVNVETPTATAPETTVATETATMAAPARESATMATTSTTTAVADPKAGEQCISGGTTISGATTVPATSDHIHASAATKWIPAAAVGTTSRSMTGRGDRKIWEKYNY